MEVFLKAFVFVLVAFSIGCSGSVDAPRDLTDRGGQGDNDTAIEEKDVVLPSTQLLLMTLKDRENLNTYKINNIFVTRKTPAQSLSKTYTFPSGFQGRVLIEWVSIGGYKPGSADEKCNADAYFDADFIVVDQNGGEQKYKIDDMAAIEAGDTLRLEIPTNLSDCSSVIFRYTLTIQL